MTNRTKELFESLNTLRYAAEHKLIDINLDEIEKSYYKLFDLLSTLKYMEDQQEQITKYEKEVKDKVESIHKKVKKKFDNMGATEIAKDITERMKTLGINKKYTITELSSGEIGISTENSNNEIVRKYDDKLDYEININDDLKTDFNREKLFSNPKKLKKGDHE